MNNTIPLKTKDLINMKITKHMLKKIVKEEFANVLDEQGYTPGEGEITRSMIKNLVEQEVGFLRTRMLLESPDTAALAADVMGGDVTAGFQTALNNIQADVTEILSLLKEPPQE
jgi:hypothetical protein